MTEITAMQNLHAALTRIREARDAVRAAEVTPERAEYLVRQVRVSMDREWDSDTPAGKAALAGMRKAAKDHVLAVAQQAHRDAAAKAVAEIEAIRAILPSLAAKAAVELGSVARMIAEGAKS